MQSSPRPRNPSPYQPPKEAGRVRPADLDEDSPFATLRQGDVLLHHPYQSFQSVLDLLQHAAHDPDVLAIKQTLYRTGKDSKIIEHLITAARNGKDVTVVVELRARFDEEANIRLADQLQEAGVQVMYGVVGYKTHAKMMLIVRREGKKLQRYVHLGTGNYHAGTARVYTDIGLMTADPDIAADVHDIFHQLSGLAPKIKLRKLLQSPFTLHKGLLKKIEREANDEFKDAVVALNAVDQARREFDADTLTLFKGTRNTCSSKVFGVLNCCKGKGFPLIPGIQLLVALGCSREEMLLHQRDVQGLCAYVGTYCSDSFLGVCLTKKKVYCCFESKLSRILQEQGRQQLNKPWGKPKTESCAGFTIDEFARLDLSQMDFSEVYAEFTDAARLPDEMQATQDIQQKIEDYYATHGN